MQGMIYRKHYRLKFQAKLRNIIFVHLMITLLRYKILLQPTWKTSEWSNCTALLPEAASNDNSTSEDVEGSGGMVYF